jgi:hypothetical protein
LGAFWIIASTGKALIFENFRITGGATQLILAANHRLIMFNCRLENTKNAGTTYCIYYNSAGVNDGPKGSKFIDCEFIGTAGATSYGFFYIGQGGVAVNAANIVFMFCFFHHVTYGFYSGLDFGELFFKCTFAYITTTAIRVITAGIEGVSVLFCSFYSAGNYFIDMEDRNGHLIYGNTFDSAVTSALYDNDVPNNRTWHINSNNFWNNGAVAIGCQIDLNNIGLDPLWVNPGALDFNFGPGSPCIDNALGIRLGV